MLTPAQIESYINGGHYRDFEYIIGVQKSREIKQLIDPQYFMPLIASRNPNEEEAIYQYRRQNVRMYTKTHFNKIVNSLQKIAAAQDYTIEWPPMPKSVREDESLQIYAAKMGSYKTFDDWLFGTALQYYLSEPNGVVIWLDEAYLHGQNDKSKRLSPQPYIFEAQDVLSYRDDPHNSHVLVGFIDYTKPSPEWLRWGNMQNYWYQPRYYYKFWYIDLNVIRVYERKYQTGKATEGFVITEIPNFTQSLLCFKLGGVNFIPQCPKVYESVINGVVPYWTEALLQYSDAQGATKNHLYPERHEYGQNDCNECHGTGQIINDLGLPTQYVTSCNVCNGTGVVKAVSALGVVQVRPQQAGEMQPAPFPAAAYVQKDIKSLEILYQVIENNINAGYRAIHFDHLAHVPANQSGIAKAYDRSELNAFYHKVSMHLFNMIAQPSYYYISLWRYLPSLGNSPNAFKQISDFQPKIHIPQNFDIQSTEGLVGYIEHSIKAGVDPYTRQELEIQLVSKQLGYFPTKQNLAIDRIVLNPFYGKSTADLEIIKASGMADDREVVLATNIDSFCRKAYEANPEFYKLPYTQKRQILLSYADEVVANVNSEVGQGQSEAEDISLENNNELNFLQ